MPFRPSTKSKVYRATIAVRGPVDKSPKWAKFRKAVKALKKHYGAKAKVKEMKPR
jgi:hypothetical protein